MSVLKQELSKYIWDIPESKLEALKPLLKNLAEDSFAIETDLTNEERKIITEGRKERLSGVEFIPFDPNNYR